MDLSRYEFSCQKALHQGLQYARSLGHPILEVEHVALALLRSEVLTPRGVNLERAKRLLENHLARMPRVYGAKRTEFGRRLDLALDAAEAAVGTKLVNEKGLWEALCRQSTVILTFLAKEASASVDDFEAMPVAKVAGEPAPRQAPSSGSPKPERADDGGAAAQAFEELQRFTIDLTARASRGELDPVIGRDAEVRRVLEVLGRRKKNNPLLIGEPGVGKSAVAEGIALRIAEGSVPEPMRHKRVLALDLGAMLAGARYRGEFEERMKKLLNIVTTLGGQVILFVDEIHMLVGAGNQEGGADAANLIKPALARGELQCLGATTIDEYRRHIERDPALERRFQPIFVDEPDRETAVAILRGLKSRYEVHHGVQIDDEALAAAVDLSIRYVTGRRLPDKAIDLIDEASSRLRLQIDSVPAILDELTAEITKIAIERKALDDNQDHQSDLEALDGRLAKARAEHAHVEALWRRHQDLLDGLKRTERKRQEAQNLYESAKTRGDFDFAARIQYGELPELEREQGRIRAELATLKGKHGYLRQVVGAREIADVVAAWTRIPATRLLEDDARKLLEIETRLAERVYGQDDALNRVGKAIRRARVGVNDPRRPLGVFLFLGPTGVGKTETAKTLAAELFADDSRLVRFDMTEFVEAHTVARLIGAPPGYVGYGEGGELTEAVRHRPYTIILLDEIEKAHARILDVLLQVFEDGRLTDGRGRTADFRNTLIIMTSNLKVDPLDGGTGSERQRRANLTRHMRPEFVNRIDDVVTFRPLGKRHLERLLRKFEDEVNQRLAGRLFRLSLGTALKGRLVEESVMDAFGGRALRRSFEALVVDALTNRLLKHPLLGSGAWTLDEDEEGHPRWRLEQRAAYYLPPGPKAKKSHPS